VCGSKTREIGLTLGVFAPVMFAILSEQQNHTRPGLQTAIAGHQVHMQVVLAIP